MEPSTVEKDYESYKALLDLWTKENPIKTNKLQVLLVVNGLLLSAVSMSGGFVPKNWPIYLGGAVFSLVWVLSIGRTSLFQKIWQAKMNELAARYREDQRFQIHDKRLHIDKAPRFLQAIGGVSSQHDLHSIGPHNGCVGRNPSIHARDLQIFELSHECGCRPGDHLAGDFHMGQLCVSFPIKNPDTMASLF